MARKNLLDGLLGTPTEKLPPGNSGAGASPSPTLSQGGAIGSVTRSIAALKSEAQEARTLRHQIEAGQAVVEIDPSRIVSSIIVDRLSHGLEGLAALVDSIRESGQQVPVLLRPHPDGSDRYQIAYGHRRVMAARELGRTVRAVIRPLSDAELVVAQGQENSARTDLSFIERALFAAKLEDAGFERAIIMAALAVDKTALSKLIAVARRIPANIIEAIGAAPKAGRDRWLQFADCLRNESDLERASGLLASLSPTETSSDERFQRVFRHLSHEGEFNSREWIVPQVARERGKSLEIEDAKFRAYLKARLDELYREFRNR
jgi:ParB family chromosome partitioning protein